ncbi:MAG: phage tail tape measure protein, partial [Roseococcus sp.]
MSATLALAAILTLKDQFSAPLRAATAATEALKGRMDGLASSAARVSAALKTAAQAASSLGTSAAQIAAVGQLATGFGLESYIRNTIGVEHRLAALGNTANMSAEDLRALDARLAAAARATNQFKADLLSANEVLIAAGLEWRTAVDITPILGEMATATQASMKDLANTAYALTSNLKVPVEQIRAAFERLTVAGQSGQFEIKDMAANFARIGASMGALQFTGLENVSRLGAALQIALRGAGDASEAANNLQNFLAKLAAPEVQNNFKKFGIDLPRLLKRARDEGLDPFLVTLKAIQKATGGDEFKLGELFGDMQVQNFIKPMLLYTDDYKRLVGEINAANGVLEGNFGRMMNTTVERWKQFRIQLETQPMPWLDDIISQMSEWLRLMNEYPKITSMIAKGLVGIAVAAIALKAAAVVLGGIGAAIGGIGRIKDWIAARKGGGAVGNAGGLLGNLAGGVQKVWVVNMPGGGLPGMGVPDTGGKAGGAARTIGARIRSLIAGVMMQASLA